jgi:uncharacterized protein with WD repeat
VSHLILIVFYSVPFTDNLRISFRVRVFQAEGAQLIQELAVPNIVELEFSPRGTYLSTWERPGAQIITVSISRPHGV